MTLFPAFLKLANRPVLVVGGGSIAASKITTLLQAGARITVVAPELNPKLAECVRARQMDWLPKRFSAKDLDGKFLVIAATSLPEVNASVFQAAEVRQILCNSVDDIDHCHFYYGSVVQRGDLQIAISTNGKSPALAQRLRRELEKQFGSEYSSWVNHLGTARDRLRAHSPDSDAIKRRLHNLASRQSFQDYQKSLAPDGHKSSIAPPSRTPASITAGAPPGKVFLIGAGPGDPDLLTLKAVRLLQSADIVLHDSLVSPEILALIPRTVERVDAGKRAGHRLLTQPDINSLLIDAALRHTCVVRLKGGDPLLFGRAAEEIDALRDAGIEFEIVPGISAAFASAAAAQFSLTDRRLASRVLFTTFSRSEETRSLCSVPISPDTTVVVYMPGPDYAEVSHWLVESGIVSETPCVVISKASQSAQAFRSTSVSSLASLRPLPAPALLIVGRVVSHSAVHSLASDWFQLVAPDSSNGLSIS